MRLDTVPHVDVNRVVEEQIADFRPEIVYTVHPDVNRDHRALFDSVAVATRPMPGQPVRRLLTYAPTSSTEWTPAGAELVRAELVRGRHRDARPQAGVVRLLRTEARDYPHPRSERAIRAAAEFFGASCGCDAAEPFVLVRALGG